MLEDRPEVQDDVCGGNTGNGLHPQHRTPIQVGWFLCTTDLEWF